MAELGQDMARLGLEYIIQTGKFSWDKIFHFLKGAGNVTYDIFDKGAHRKSAQKSADGKSAEDAVKDAAEDISDAGPEGSMRVDSIQNLMDEGVKWESVDITDFEDKEKLQHFLRLYDVDCAVRADHSTDPPTYHVFFKSDDGDIAKITDAFKDYANQDKGENSRKTPSVSPREEINRIARDTHKQRGMEQVRTRALKHEMDRGH